MVTPVEPMTQHPTRLWRRPGLLLPVIGFIALAVVLYMGLGRNPREVPSPLIGKAVPTFVLPPVQGRTLGLSSKDLVGSVSIVNIFASWCSPCRQEHPLLVALDKEKLVPIFGINYKDKPQDAGPWLDELGDPYTRTGADVDGRVGIDWGVYGVPETYVVGSDGRIAYKHTGPLTQTVIDQQIRPLVARLESASPPR